MMVWGKDMNISFTFGARARWRTRCISNNTYKVAQTPTNEIIESI